MDPTPAKASVDPFLDEYLHLTDPFLDEYLHLTAFIGAVAPQMEPSWVMPLSDLTHPELLRIFFSNVLLLHFQWNRKMVCSMFQRGPGSFSISSNTGFSPAEAAFCKRLHQLIGQRSRQGLKDARAEVIEKAKLMGEKKKRKAAADANGKGKKKCKSSAGEEEDGIQAVQEALRCLTSGHRFSQEALDHWMLSEECFVGLYKHFRGSSLQVITTGAAQPGSSADEELPLAADPTDQSSGTFQQSSGSVLGSEASCSTQESDTSGSSQEKPKFKYSWEKLEGFLSGRGCFLHKLDPAFSDRVAALKEMFENNPKLGLKVVHHSECRAADETPYRAADETPDAKKPELGKQLFMFCVKLCCSPCFTRMKRSRIAALGTHGKMYASVAVSKQVKQEMDEKIDRHLKKVFSGGYDLSEEDRAPEASMHRFFQQLEDEAKAVHRW